MKLQTVTKQYQDHVGEQTTNLGTLQAALDHKTKELEEVRNAWEEYRAHVGDTTSKHEESTQEQAKVHQQLQDTLSLSNDRLAKMQMLVAAKEEELQKEHERALAAADVLEKRMLDKVIQVQGKYEELLTAANDGSAAKLNEFKQECESKISELNKVMDTYACSPTARREDERNI